ncbi:hypothetical protein [Streptomyces aureoversilis]|uniref:Uncharacterized protein n=1 Tax=Streptomyces aureoversilis TaxID=67277 RepID=A0ABV9ZVP5_9ACTN
MTDRIRLDDLTSSQLDQLYDQLDILRGFCDVVLLELESWHPTESPRLLRTELAALSAALRAAP